jgi:hypothetical protein
MNDICQTISRNLAYNCVLRRPTLFMTLLFSIWIPLGSRVLFRGGLIQEQLYISDLQISLAYGVLIPRLAMFVIYS